MKFREIVQPWLARKEMTVKPSTCAALIAAAPELYEALRLVLETIDALGFKPVVESDPLAVAVKCGEKALEKAGGEE